MSSESMEVLSGMRCSFFVCFAQTIAQSLPSWLLSAHVVAARFQQLFRFALIRRRAPNHPLLDEGHQLGFRLCVQGMQ